jgi:arabinogalactan oligomer/maltooligosaccharide transport system permease protein
MTTHTSSGARGRTAAGLLSNPRKLVADLLTHATLILVCVIMLFPAFWVLSTSFKRQEEIESSTITIIPRDFTWDNYEHVLTGMKGRVVVPGEGRQEINLFLRWGRNSLVVATVTTVIGVLLAATAAYAFSRYQFIGRRPMLLWFLITQMFPGAILIVPLYNLLNEWDLLNKWHGLVFAYSTVALPFSTWMLKGFFDAVPYDLEEAAIVDGTSRFGAYWRIALPLTLPGIAVVGFYNFMAAWNEFMMALTFMTGEQNKTLPVGLRNFVFQFNTDWHYMAAGSVIVTIPVMIGFLWAQRYLIAGLTAGGVKG